MNLKPCPFCGGEPEVKRVGNAHMKKVAVHIYCTTFGCTVEMRCAELTRHGGNHEQCEKWAIEKWNTRHEHLVPTEHMRNKGGQNE